PSAGLARGGDLSTAAFVLSRGRVRGAARVAACCAAAATAAGRDWLVLETSAGAPGRFLARRAVAAGAGLVFAVGGDGTVRACAEALAGTAIPLAIVPRGTANLAARALGIPHPLGAALATGFGGDERPIHLATADGAAFAAMDRPGPDAAGVAAAPPALNARAGGPAHAPAAGR